MAGYQVLTPVEIDSLKKELDIFSGERTPRPELILKGLYPPLPICSDTLIWGFAILRAAKAQQLRQLNCLIIPSCPRDEMLSLALKLENRASGFSWREKEKMLAFLAAPEPSSERRPESPSPPAPLVAAFDQLSPLIENHRDPELASKIATFAELPEALQDLVAEGQVDLKTAVRVRSLPVEIFPEIQASTLSFSQNRQFLNELFEVARKHERSQQEIKETVARALRDRRPLEAIHRLRFPTLTALDERFTNLKRELLRGSGVRLEPPPYYEGQAFTVQFEFNSARTFSRRLTALHTLEGRLDALFELLH
jgi:hypothetical protein